MTPEQHERLRHAREAAQDFHPEDYEQYGEEFYHRYKNEESMTKEEYEAYLKSWHRANEKRIKPQSRSPAATATLTGIAIQHGNANLIINTIREKASKEFTEIEKKT